MSSLCPDCGEPVTEAESTCLKCLFQLGLQEVAAGEEADSIIGDYRLVRRIGEGGMGEVWEADQLHPVKRTVAFKLIKLGMDTRQVVARFESERQALAMMDHPNIAKILDAGATESGRPYFVMELVQGAPVHHYCDHRSLPTEARLELFVDICLAVQHAHQKGIIHRDLKPSNILVSEHDGRAVAKVIDFGVAMATEGQIAGETIHTMAHQLLGTPAYMAPEQAQADAGVDARADIYSLGVILYQLMTGAPPFDAKRLKSAGLAEMQRILREEEPDRPSTRVITEERESGDLVSRTGVEAKTLITKIRGDVDWIVMKAIAKEPDRRYGSAGELAADVKRHLRHEEVLACPPSTAYRLGKLARRHRSALVTVVAVVATLVLGLVLAVWQAVRATQAEHREGAERRKAENQAAIAKATVDFLEEDLLDLTNPSKEPDRDLKLRVVLDRALKKLDSRFEDQPRTKANLLLTLGKVYKGLGEYHLAIAQIDKALALTKSELGADPLLVNTLLLQKGSVLTELDHFEKALAIIEPLAEERTRSLGRQDVETLGTLGLLARLYANTMRPERAFPLFHEVIEGYRAAGMGEHVQCQSVMSSLGTAYILNRKLKEAEDVFNELLELALTKGEEGAALASAMNNVAVAVGMQGDDEKAITLTKESLQIHRRVHGPEHDLTLSTMHNLAGMLSSQRRYEEAIALWEVTWPLREKLNGVDNEMTLWNGLRLCQAYEASGKSAKSLEGFKKVLRFAHQGLGDRHWITNQAYAALEQRLTPATLAGFLDGICQDPSWDLEREQVFVSEGSLWKFDDRGQALDESWKLLAFDDDGWSSGRAPLGYGETDIVTRVSFGEDPDNKQPTTYFRTVFENPLAEEPLERLRFRIRRDDGAVIYLNGEEIARHHLPDGPVSYAQHTEIAVQQLDELTFVTEELPPTLLRTGPNVLAVEIHQASPSSSDLLFDFALEGMTKARN